MPLRDFKCTECDNAEERYYREGEEILCSACNAGMEKAPLSFRIQGKTGVFPYTTTNLTGDGKPVTIESMSHLRSLENKYGVCVSGFSQNESNGMDSMGQLPVHRPGGRKYEAEQESMREHLSREYHRRRR